jgi:hypothetical protein
MRTTLATAVLFLALHANAQLVLLVEDPVVREATSRRGAIVEYNVYAYGGQNPDPTVTCDHPSGSLFPMGPTHVKCVASNRAGERGLGEAYVYVYDGTSPVLTLPDDIIVRAESKEGTVVRFEAKANDAIDGQVAVGCAPGSGSLFPIGVTTVECNAADSSMNPTYGTFTVKVVENDPGLLVIQVPDPITAEATSDDGARVRFAVTAHGSEDPEPSISCDPASNSMFPLGTTKVICIATDRFGGRAEGEFTVTIVDTTPPVLHLSDIRVEGTSDAGAEVEFTYTATDLVDGTILATCHPPSGSQFPYGSTKVQCTATDAHGNGAADSFMVTVTDSTPPHIASVTASPDVLQPPNHELVPVTITVDAVDMGDPSPRCSIYDVTANEPIVGAGSGNTNFDWRVTGALTLELRAERSGQGDGRIYEVHVDCRDSSGNDSTASAKVTVPKGGGSGEEATVVTKTPTRRRSVGKG